MEAVGGIVGGMVGRDGTSFVADSYPDYDGFGIYHPDPAHASTVALMVEKASQMRSRIAATEPLFSRGDSNCDGELDISDPVHILLGLFSGGGGSCCAAAEDANDDGRADLSDAIHILSFIFAGGPSPPPPYPGCGSDPTPNEPGLTCARRPSC
jgi:hypothetical protein